MAGMNVWNINGYGLSLQQAKACRGAPPAPGRAGSPWYISLVFMGLFGLAGGAVFVLWPFAACCFFFDKWSWIGFLKAANCCGDNFRAIVDWRCISGLLAEVRLAKFVKAHGRWRFSPAGQGFAGLGLVWRRCA